MPIRSSSCRLSCATASVPKPLALYPFFEGFVGFFVAGFLDGFFFDDFLDGLSSPLYGKVGVSRYCSYTSACSPMVGMTLIPRSLILSINPPQLSLHLRMDRKPSIEECRTTSKRHPRVFSKRTIQISPCSSS